MLGFSLDLNQGNISVPEQRICKLQESVRKVSPSMTVRQLASIVGQIVYIHESRARFCSQVDDPEPVHHNQL